MFVIFSFKTKKVYYSTKCVFFFLSTVSLSSNISSIQRYYSFHTAIEFQDTSIHHSAFPPFPPLPPLS